MRHLALVMFGLALGAGTTYLFSNKILNSIGSEENIEQKIEDVNILSDSELEKKYGDLSLLFGSCDPIAEYEFITERLSCNKRKNKALKYWTNMRRAEKEVKDALVKNDVDKLLSYTSCDAYDLTWYELHCEADRLRVDDSSYSSLYEYIDKVGFDIIKKSKWKRNKPNKRRLRNPRWLRRSRLYSKKFKLNDPWSNENHPTEFGTIILLEQKLDGKIYIVGIPITGTLRTVQ